MNGSPHAAASSTDRLQPEENERKPQAAPSYPPVHVCVPFCQSHTAAEEKERQSQPACLPLYVYIYMSAGQREDHTTCAAMKCKYGSRCGPCLALLRAHHSVEHRGEEWPLALACKALAF
jgi:hypothetical protein